MFSRQEGAGGNISLLITLYISNSFLANSNLYICIISNTNSLSNIFVVLTVKNLNFIYSDFIFL